MPPALSATARHQFGAFCALQAERAGVSPRQLRRWAERGVIRRVGRSVFVVAGAPRTPEQDAWIAVLAVGEPCAVAGLTLASLRGWPLGRATPMPPQLLVPETRRIRTMKAAVVTRARWWSADDVCRDDPTGLPLLQFAAGLITLAPQVSDAALLAVVQHGAYHGELDLPDLLVRCHRGVPNARRVRGAVATYLGGFDSTREVEVHRILRARGRAPQHLNVILVDAAGIRVGPIDGYDEGGVGYQFDGAAAHERLRQVNRDAATNERAARMGITLLRARSRDIRSRGRFADEWAEAVTAACRHPRLVAPPITVIHLPGRTCPCGATG